MSGSGHAFLFTAYHDPDLIQRVLETYIPYGDCFIHFDKKSAVPQSFLQWAAEKKNVFVFQRYRINWGDWRHVAAVLYLMQHAVSRDDGYRFFHILSADTVMVAPPEEVLSFFEQTPDINYMSCGKVPPPGKEAEWAVREWFCYYHINALVNKKKPFWNQADFWLTRLQMKLGIRRKVDFAYSGLLYGHYTRAFTEYALEYVQSHPAYMRSMKPVNIPEEFFFQNILMTSPFADKTVDDIKLYTKWDAGSRAVFLEKEDCETARKNGYLFARKIGKESGDTVFDMVS